MRFHRLAYVLIASCTVLVAGTSLIRTFQRFYQVDFPISWVEEGLRVDEVPPHSTGDLAELKTGDLITALDGVPIHRFDNPLFSLASGTKHILTIDRDGFDIGNIAFSPPPPQIEEVYLARSAVGAFGLFCATIAAFSARRRETMTFLLLASASFLVGAIPHRTAASAISLSVLHRSAGAAMPFLLFRFFAIFPNQRRRMAPWDAITLLAVLGVGLSPLVPDLQAWWPAMLSGLRFLFTTSLVFGIVVQVQRWWTAQDQERDRRQIEWAGLGLFVGLTPMVTLVFIPGWLGITFEPFSWLAILPLAAIPLGFLAALTEYRLWDLEPISRDLVSATLIVASGGFVFSLTNHILQTYAAGLGNIRNLLAFATGIILVLLLEPVRQRVEPFLDQWLHHGRPTPRWLLTHSTRDLATAEDPRRLLTTLGEILVSGLEIDPVATFLRTDSNTFRKVFPKEDDRQPFLLASDIEKQPFPHPSEQVLAHQGFTQRILLERGGTTHGLLYLGLRRGLAPLGSEAGGVVSAFAAQTALGLENARRLDELRRQAEEYRILHANTQRIIESSAAGILVCDAGGRILSANSGAAEIFGLLARDLVGNTLETYLVLPETWRPQLPIHAVNAEAKTVGSPIIRLILAVSVLELDTGTFNGRVVVAQNVTELRKLQDRVREQERLAGLGRLTAGLAHEINTPLTGIASYAQMLGDMTPPDDPRSALLDKLVNQSFRVSRIVANLRELFQGRGGEGALMDVGQAVTQAAKDAIKSIQADNPLLLDIPKQEMLVWASPGAIDLAIANLVRNAVEASPPDGAISIGVTQDEPGVLITIDDHGQGVPPGLRDRVFQAFVTTKTERGGTGLGLAITRDMIAQFGGEVWLEDLPGGGTRAAIRLHPCRQPPASS
jgi:PAS domain S-box-containing protein